MSAQISQEVLDIVAKLIRYKMIHWEWQKILDNQNKEMWTNQQIFEAMSTKVDYKSEEKTRIEYFYVIKMGKERFIIMRDLEKDIIRVYYPVKEGMKIEEKKAFLEFSEEALEEMGRE